MYSNTSMMESECQLRYCIDIDIVFLHTIISRQSLRLTTRFSNAVVVNHTPQSIII
jgi:hypothetical protein